MQQELDSHSRDGLVRDCIASSLRSHWASRSLQQQAVSELKISNEELTQFAFVAAHDIAAPLTRVSGFSNLLREEYEDSLDDNGRQYVDYIHAAATRLSEIVEELLCYTRLGTIDKNLQGMNIFSLAMSIADDFSCNYLH